MEKDKHITEVVFRKLIDGDIIALFPYIIDDQVGNVQSYMHVGQHSAADYQATILQTKLATKSEYEELKDELENYCGYNLKVIKRYNHNKYMVALREALNMD